MRCQPQAVLGTDAGELEGIAALIASDLLVYSGMR